MAQLKIIDLGKMPYDRALEEQMRRVDEVKQADRDLGYLLLVEHDPPVITLGRAAEENNILLNHTELERRGIELRHISRGGDVTWHGPGQIVGYPIVRLDLRGRDVHRYLRNIEEIVIRTIAEYGVEGRRVEGLTGVWVGEEKIAATGIAITRWVSYHGFALNVSSDLSHFDLIVPCGIIDKGVCNLEQAAGRGVSIPEVKEKLSCHTAQVLGFDGFDTCSLSDLD
ncbi:MAG: lipoyl(octanoyl) transferase LipB [Candidatus Sumerlaeota bacterium]